MPYQYHINRHQQLCYVVLYGRIDGDQLINAISSLTSHPEWRPGYTTLWDGTAIEETAFSLSKVRRVRRVAEDFSNKLGPGKSAYVATRNIDRIAALLLRLTIHIPGREIRVFTSLRDARHWLGLGSAPLKGPMPDPPEVPYGSNA